MELCIDDIVPMAKCPFELLFKIVIVIVLVVVVVVTWNCLFHYLKYFYINIISNLLRILYTNNFFEY